MGRLPCCHQPSLNISFHPQPPSSRKKAPALPSNLVPGIRPRDPHPWSLFFPAVSTGNISLAKATVSLPPNPGHGGQIIDISCYSPTRIQTLCVHIGANCCYGSHTGNVRLTYLKDVSGFELQILSHIMFNYLY